MARRKITMEQDLELPAVPHLPAIAVTGPSQPNNAASGQDDELLDLIIQPEAVPDVHSAMDNYLEAVPVGERQSSDAAVLQRRVSAPTSSLRVEWQRGTNGHPREGSRSLRLCRGEPTAVAKRIPQVPSELLLLDASSKIEEDADASLAWNGLLFIARGHHEVPVALTLRWFNPRFTLTEIQITAKKHYPRRFFGTAHRALGFLET